MICQKCCFFATNSFNDRMGVCKRYPEERNKSHNDWCGEYKAVKEIKIVKPKGEKIANQGKQ